MEVSNNPYEGIEAGYEAFWEQYLKELGYEQSPEVQDANKNSWKISSEQSDGVQGHQEKEAAKPFTKSQPESATMETVVTQPRANMGIARQPVVTTHCYIYL